MHRLFTAAAVAAALAIPASVATVGLVSTTAGAAGSSISCTGLKGTISGTITIKKCSPVSPVKATAKAFKSASAPSASLATGGNITWNGGGVTTIGDAVVTGGTSQGPCKSGSDEYNFTGQVTGQTGGSGTGVPAVGDAVSASACVASKNGKISLAPGTTMKL